MKRSIRFLSVFIWWSCWLGTLAGRISFPAFAGPALTIEYQSASQAAVTWMESGQYILQTNNNISTTNWGAYTGLITSGGGTNLVFVSMGPGNQFFRLALVVTNSGGFSDPTSIPGLVYYWNFEDLAVNSPVNAWTDRVSGVVLEPARTDSPPTDYNLGVLFNDDPNSLTNIPITVSSNFSLWYVVRPQPVGRGISINDGNVHTLFGEAGNGGGGLGLAYSNGVIMGYWGSTTQLSSAVFQTSSNYYDPAYDIVDSDGTLYTNATSLAVGVGQPTNNFVFQSVGANFNANNPYGYVQYIGIWTNYALSASDVANLDNWVNTNGVTNVVNGLAAWWKLDDDSGTNFVDSSGNGWTGTLLGGPLWTNSVINDGLYFNGSSAWGVVSNSAGLMNNFTNGTVTCWWKSSALVTNLAEIILAKCGGGGEAPDDGPGWYLFQEGSPDGSLTDVRGEIDDANSKNYIETQSVEFLNDGQWHFLAFQVTTNQPYIWVDGVEMKLDEEINVGPVKNFGTTNNITLSYDTVGDNFGNQTLDDIRFYNRLLTPQEIAMLYRWRGQP